MAHTEVGFKVINKFLEDIAPYGHPDFQAKLIGRGINVMISPLPRNKRAKNPRGEGALPPEAPELDGEEAEDEESSQKQEPKRQPNAVAIDRGTSSETDEDKNFTNNPFAQLEARR